MRRRLRHAVLFAVLAMQALVAPALFASSAFTHPSTSSSSCPDQMGHGDEPCPCCPDGLMVAGCMSLCTAFASDAAVPMPLFKPIPDPAIPFHEPTSSTRTDPPLNPPPIR